MTMNKILIAATLVIASIAGVKLFAHCQIPCGIYNDDARFVLMQEHVTTLAKSMKMIDTLSKESPPNWNQITRWVNNKEKHADELTEIVTYYFMAQRIKPVQAEDKDAYSKYLHELTLLHQMIVHAMQAKQTTDEEHVNKLNALIHDFEHSYMGEK
ncbi:MAG: superoxide dismutase [Ni] [Planctomycetota bacterium]